MLAFLIINKAQMKSKKCIGCLQVLYVVWCLCISTGLTSYMLYLTVSVSPVSCCSVFWDLYCAAPDRRETCEHSSEAKAFHDYVSDRQTWQSFSLLGGVGRAEPQPLVQWQCALGLGLSLNLLFMFIDVMVFSEWHMADLLTKASHDASTP